MLQKKNHFCSELEGRFFLCINCDEYPKIIREVRERIKSLVPFLDVIGDPYLISTSINNRPKEYNIDQNQYWIVEGYTSSVTYPYASRPPDGIPIRYIRNSVKAVVDSYNGSIKLYISEPSDPIPL
mgnify:CR=1 FL=1